MLEKYFPGGPYRFHMQFGRGTLADFYRPTAEHEEILRERQAWLQAEEERCLVICAGASALIEEAADLAAGTGTAPPLPAGITGDRARARFLGEQWEPDFLLLTRDGGLRLVCGCVCFPSSWSVGEKIGRRLEEIHHVVPGLNAAIGAQIQTFLERIKPGVSWTRSNWGLSRSPERNQHPARRLPRLDAAVRLDEVWFRVEEQSLAVLPRSGGILFGIRIQVTPLRRFLGTAAGAKLREALQTMPRSLAEYKGIEPARERLLELLT